jgi:hypothetical protein
MHSIDSHVKYDLDLGDGMGNIQNAVKLGLLQPVLKFPNILKIKNES